MTLTEINDAINKICTGCKQCDPCCTGNVLKKCIENDRFCSSAVTPARVAK